VRDGAVTKRAIWAAAIVAWGLTAAAALADEPGSRPAACGLPTRLVALHGALPHAAAAVRSRHALTIVAFGSSSTYGTGASGPAATYPSRLEVELAKLLPGIQLSVINRGVPGDIAADMTARLEHDVIAAAPDLVVWQTGTNDALRNVPVDTFARLTAAGIERMHDAGIDVVLMEPQYSRKLASRPHYAEYVESLRTLGHAAGVPVVRRFDIMQAWLASGTFVGGTMLQSDALHMRDASYACLGRAVAEGLVEAIDQTGRGSARLTAHATAAK
jgi:acyl-CoA thioesterase I